MRVWNDLNGDSQSLRRGTVTIGKFDGLHLGHQELLKELKKGPKPQIVLTFEPHPLQVLQPERKLTKIFPKEDLAEQLPRYGVDLLAVIPFSIAVAQQSAAEFAENSLWTPFRPKNLVVGYDFAFGHNREGSIDWLKNWCVQKNIQLSVVEPKKVDGEVASSRRLRELILNGDVSGARSLLGRSFYLRGVVQRGAGRGRTIGFPTLNQTVVNETIPALGVYCTRTQLGGQIYDSVTNVGKVPTFTDETQVHVETHLLDIDKDGYGAAIDVNFIKRLRPEKKFASVDDLKKQIEQDILEARRCLANEKVDLHKSDQ